MGARSHDLDPTAACEVTHLSAQPRQLAREVGDRRKDGGEHLHTRPRELRGDEPRVLPRGEHLIYRRGQLARGRVDQLKLLLDPDRIRRRRAESTLHPRTLALQHFSTLRPLRPPLVSISASQLCWERLALIVLSLRKARYRLLRSLAVSLWRVFAAMLSG